MVLFQEGHTLFTIPRSLTLSTRTSLVPALLGPVKWKNHELDKGWVGLILCMMWEEAQGASSKWSRYMGAYVPFGSCFSITIDAVVRGAS